ncbi:energy transducer TonB [Crocinitomicaceae bacterium]|nr:energy transducer TonB [Crocinitomicaceae bacterium]MDC0257780.1 energy transducer TonB [Crocinitomicaceae bacterium]
MEIKKSESVDIERVKWALALIGLLFVSGVLLASFTFKTVVEDQGLSDSKISENNSGIEVEEELEEEIVEEVEQETVETTPPPVEEIKEKENEEKEPKAAPPVPPPPKKKAAPVKQVKAEIIDFPDVEAAFPGGAAALQSYIVNNIQYPETSIDMDEQGKVYLSFVVGADGSISQVKVERGVSRDLDREAKRVVRSMPKWVPGEAGGKKVATRCRLPIVFTLN